MLGDKTKLELKIKKILTWTITADSKIIQKYDNFILTESDRRTENILLPWFVLTSSIECHCSLWLYFKVLNEAHKKEHLMILSFYRYISLLS